MHVKRGDLDDWIKELDDRGIKEFKFKDLPNDLKNRMWIQKARGLGLLESIRVTNGRHIWKVIPANISKKVHNVDKKENKKE